MDFEQLGLFDLPDNTLVKLEEAGDEIGRVFLNAAACPACFVGSHSGCYHPVATEEGTFCCCPDTSVEEGSSETKSAVERFKEASEVTDVTSTGRKRAAAAYPITEGMICEWAKLARSGGGHRPIIGCVGNPATDIHHGPDKNTLNNTPENVHRICANCHNRWHAANDPFYGKRPAGTVPFIPLDGYDWGPHDSDTKATDAQIAASEIYWATPKAKRPPYETLTKEIAQ